MTLLSKAQARNLELLQKVGSVITRTYGTSSHPGFNKRCLFKLAGMGRIQVTKVEIKSCMMTRQGSTFEMQYDEITWSPANAPLEEVLQMNETTLKGSLYGS